MMTREQLQEAIESTKLEIVDLKQQIRQTTDPRQARKLTIKLRELQYLQLWHIDQLQHLWKQRDG